jgi:hypothetical protein
VTPPSAPAKCLPCGICNLYMYSVLCSIILLSSSTIATADGSRHRRQQLVRDFNMYIQMTYYLKLCCSSGRLSRVLLRGRGFSVWKIRAFFFESRGLSRVCQYDFRMTRISQSPTFFNTTTIPRCHQRRRRQPQRRSPLAARRR